MCGDLSKDIALIGQQNDQQTTPSQYEDYQWQTFTNNLEVQYIPTNTNLS